MAKFQSPLLGYNNNVRHKGRAFHIQTEDSGINHPHIITHLFMDGGRILKSVKKSYAEHIGTDNMSETVRGLMKEQHKAIFIALRDGQFDELADLGVKKPSGAVIAPSSSEMKTAAKAPDPVLRPPPSTAPDLSTAATQEAPPPTAPEGRGVALKTAILAAPKVSTDAIPVADHEARLSNRRGLDSRPPLSKWEQQRTFTPEDLAPPTIDERNHAIAYGADPPLPPELEALLRDELLPLDAPAAPAPAPAPAPPPNASTQAGADVEPATTREPSQHVTAQELTLDFDALERDSGVSPMFQQADLPPPPKNLFAKEPRTGAYSTLDGGARNDAASKPGARPGPGRPPAAPPADGAGAPGKKAASDARYAPARPAAIFSAAPKQAAPSIFSDDLVSDKSLDEVILSYLAEDLDPPQRK